MRSKILCLLFICALLAACASKDVPSNSLPSGTWSGDYGPDADRREPVTLDLRWEKTALHGTVHSGPRSLEVSQAQFKPETGAITLQFDAEANGRTVHYLIDGKVEGNHISGTWSHDGQKGDFKVTRQ